ncbi:DUF3592 domain-containing protein [Pseudoduganella armeniaca]|uniref:DUF3592 domain-containing protein n=1 Tax=Pseudoduganella armeniaca TaxID=2072590 RepID=A0A2R4CEV2_9BURK|nr:DUF3592 domain-containing protein [Pseudoduganella armeniaca]AVR98164.1 hypothetical protein C9I28_22870 [Pseudoduganella armeniaca]
MMRPSAAGDPFAIPCRDDVAAGTHRTSAWIIGVICAIALLLGGIRIHGKFDASTWPAVRAQVDSVKVYHRSGRGQDWCNLVSYRYVVDGKRYTSRRMASSLIGASGCHKTEAEATWHAGRLLRAGGVRAYYDPAAPAHAILVKDRLDVLDYFALGVAAFAALVACREWRCYRRKTR